MKVLVLSLMLAVVQVAGAAAPPVPTAHYTFTLPARAITWKVSWVLLDGSGVEHTTRQTYPVTCAKPAKDDLVKSCQVDLPARADKQWLVTPYEMNKRGAILPIQGGVACGPPPTGCFPLAAEPWDRDPD